VLTSAMAVGLLVFVVQITGQKRREPSQAAKKARNQNRR
jgi:hypothetical protein